jgi:hypothetical protein
MSEIQIDYTSRDYAGLKADIISLITQKTGVNWEVTDPNDLGSILIESFAYMGDIMSYYLDRIANETSVDTATKRENLLNFAALYGYKPTGPTPATLRVKFMNTHDTDTVDIPTGTQVLAVLSYGNFSEVYFETTEAATAVLPGQEISLACIEGKTVNTDRPDLISPITNKPLPTILETSNGSANQEVNIIDIGIVDNSLSVYIGQDVAFATWEYKDTLVESGPQDLVFTTRQNEDGTLTIIFGDGITGAIPANGQTISALYRTSTGVAGNVSTGSISEVTFVPGNLDPEIISYIQARNIEPAVGGADSDNTTQLRAKIKAAISARKRAVTLKDYEYLVSLMPQVGKVKADAVVSSLVNLYVQSSADQTATPGVIVQSGTIVSITGDGSYITVTTDDLHLYDVGQIVNITGVDPTVYNLTDVVIYDIPSTTTFRIADTHTDVYVSGGTVAGTTTSISWKALKQSILTTMADRIPVGTTISVFPPAYVPIYVTMVVTVDDAYRTSAVTLDIYKAFLGTNGLFIFDNNTFGRNLYLSSIIKSAASVDGVLAVDITQLCTDGTASVVSPLILDPDQVPYLLPANLVITTVGGL